jgi:hypothetical protein
MNPWWSGGGPRECGRGCLPLSPALPWTRAWKTCLSWIEIWVRLREATCVIDKVKSKWMTTIVRCYSTRISVESMTCTQGSNHLKGNALSSEHIVNMSLQDYTIIPRCHVLP